VALGGDCLADIAVLREEPGVFGSVASDPTVSRLLSTLGADAPAALAAINTARAGARRAAWAHAGAHAPDHLISAKDPVIIDLDATLVSWRKNTRPRRRSGASDTTRCVRSLTTARPAPANLWPCSYARATPGPTLLLITSA